MGMVKIFISEKYFLRVAVGQRGASGLHLQGSIVVLERDWSPWQECEPELCSHLHAPGACKCVQKVLEFPG